MRSSFVDEQRVHAFAPTLAVKRFVLAIAFVVVLGLGTMPAGAILSGQPDDTNHPYVGMVTSSTLTGVCSGAAISPTKFVTAAHCFGTGPGTRVLVSFEPDGFNNYPAGVVSGTWYPHPDWCSPCGNGVTGFDLNDVAVVILDAPIALAEYGDLPSLGQAAALPQKTGVSLVGYGLQERPKKLDPNNPEGFTRFFAPSELVQSNDALAGNFLKLTANASKGKGGMCFGDSGGPVILEGSGLGNDTILGVNTFLNNINCAGVTYHNRIDISVTRDFINGVN